MKMIPMMALVACHFSQTVIHLGQTVQIEVMPWELDTGGSIPTHAGLLWHQRPSENMLLEAQKNLEQD